jgi:pimeloyl-ACP methyl ester carboxylesterase
MPKFEYDSTSIYFEEHGGGSPVLLIAPGAMESTVEMWSDATINPLVRYEDSFRLIAMDQRNSGRSAGPLEVSDPWGAYARDQVALLDHLGVDRFQVIGCCIGVSFALKLIEQAPGRVAAAVLMQPVGITDGNGPLYEEMWRSWAARLSRRHDHSPQTLEGFGIRMWQSDFVVSVTRSFVRSCETPLLILPGTDRYHPGATAHEIAELAVDARVLEPWNDTRPHTDEATEEVRTFLRTHVPEDPS